MIAAPPIETLRRALAPVEALRGEQSQLESWVLESFASLEALQAELAEWQRELTRQQAALDQREAAVAEAQSGVGLGAADVELAEKLRQAQEEIRQLEEENADQLQAVDDLDRKLIAAHAEARVLRTHAEELKSAWETERGRADDEHRHWTAELKEMRRLLARQGDALAWLAGPDFDGAAIGDAELPNAGRLPDAPPEAVPDADMAARTAELHRRANFRRAAHRRPA